MRFCHRILLLTCTQGVALALRPRFGAASWQRTGASTRLIEHIWSEGALNGPQPPAFMLGRCCCLVFCVVMRSFPPLQRITPSSGLASRCKREDPFTPFFIVFRAKTPSPSSALASSMYENTLPQFARPCASKKRSFSRFGCVPQAPSRVRARGHWPYR